MKKNTFFMSAMIICSALVISCSSDDEEVVNKDTARQYETPTEMLDRMNRENPFSSIGIMHNLVLDKLMKSANSDLTRSPADSIANYSTMRSNAYSEYLELEERPMTEIEFIALFDEIMEESLAPISSSAGVAIKAYMQNNQLKAYVDSLDNVVDDIDTCLVSLLSRVDNVQTSIGGFPSSTDKQMVLSMASIAANSLSYWHENAEQQPIPLPMDPEAFSISPKWKRAGVYDYRTGKAIWKYARAGGTWGWVAGGVITGAASALGYLND